MSGQWEQQGGMRPVTLTESIIQQKLCHTTPPRFGTLLQVMQKEFRKVCVCVCVCCVQILSDMQSPSHSLISAHLLSTPPGSQPCRVLSSTTESLRCVCVRLRARPARLLQMLSDFSHAAEAATVLWKHESTLR